ncbi:MAG TPA: malto-oligosyltrehalose synthase [Blastocatellia bacterium]|nr:malto-oligosyltrehalose synthase [Blastocatellia bacterium]
MRVPSSTYRLQLNPNFGFKAARTIIPYLAELGITTIYASPIFKSRKGSAHGYDVTDPNQINSELGTIEDFNALVDTVHKHGLRWLQDFVPNHVAYDSHNLMLMDVFEKGPGSPYFSFFDIVWDHLRENLRGKVIAPFLGKPFGETLESGEILLQYGDGVFSVKYYDSIYPLKIESYATIINHGLSELREQLGEEDASFIKLLGIASVLTGLSDDPNVDQMARTSQMILARDSLSDTYRDNSVIREFVNRQVSEFNRDVNLLDDLLAQQWFQLTYWRVATKEINYQRFFNINELISLRMEDERVFESIHKFVFSLLSEGKIDGLRIDHIDGLYDPTGYLLRLRERAGDAFIVVEKILAPAEPLPQGWPVQGTTGYDFMSCTDALFVDSRNEQEFQNLYSTFTGEQLEYEDLLYEKKKLLIERHLTGDLDNLTSLLKTLSTTTRDAIDLEWEALMMAIAETAAVFPVYRTYIAGDPVEGRDRAYVSDAIEKAEARNPTLARALVFLKAVLLLNYPEHLAEEHNRLWLAFVMRFQQFTSPLMAKGMEDTTFYVFNRLTSLNEVGGDPGRFGISVDDFHSFNEQRAKHHPHTLNATATHDNKRGEDVRARISVLSEMPKQWHEHLELWYEQNRSLKQIVEGEEVPNRNREYFLYQTLIGAWPFEERERDDFINRMKDYMMKAAREAKTHTFWLDHNAEYEEALASFTEKILTPSVSGEFLNSFTAFQKKIAHYGVFNSLTQTLLKLTSPGTPDFYQGTELWDLNLVDPDNRRAVDYEKREWLLREMKQKGESALLDLVDELLSTREDNRVKLFTIHRAMAARNARKELFEESNYVRLSARGSRSNHIIAFARRKVEHWALAIAPRFLTSIVSENELPLGQDVWSDTSIEMPADATRAWRNVFTDEVISGQGSISVAEALGRFAIALLIGEY